MPTSVPAGTVVICSTKRCTPQFGSCLAPGATCRSDKLTIPAALCTISQVRAGAVAERVATEGVLLQYAVDTKLDMCLSNIYEAVTRPPLPLNPYPRLLHILRANAAKLDLFQASGLFVIVGPTTTLCRIAWCLFAWDQMAMHVRCALRIGVTCHVEVSLNKLGPSAA